MLVQIGNIFDSKAKTLVNTVNCVGVMGKGIALEFKNRYPSMYKEYVSLCKSGDVKPGVPYFHRDLLGTSILNFPTKDHWRSPSKLSYVISGLDWFVDNYSNLGIDSIAFPPLGCGNGGLSWEIVGPIMYQKLKDLPIDIEIYAPFGTKQEQLSLKFLDRPLVNNNDVLGIKLAKRNNNWDLLMYVVRELSQYKYSLYVGRTIFQKICYVMTRQGINTGFEFSKGSYGPYSPQIKEAISILSNSNLIREDNCNQMIRMIVSDSFDFDKSQFSAKEIEAADKTIDLFSRVKNTEQAEMISTVLYSYDQLSSKSSNKQVLDCDIYSFVTNWKKHWKPSKDAAIYSTIENLSMLEWINAFPSNKFDYDEL